MTRRIYSLAVATLVITGCESREHRENREAAERFMQSDAGYEARYRARQNMDSNLATLVRVADSAGVSSCQHIKHLELYEVAASEKQLVTRLRSEAAQSRADAIVFSTPAGLQERIAGEAYRCGPAPKVEGGQFR